MVFEAFEESKEKLATQVSEALEQFKAAPFLAGSDYSLSDLHDTGRSYVSVTLRWFSVSLVRTFGRRLESHLPYVGTYGGINSLICWSQCALESAVSDSMILTVITLEFVVIMFERYPEPHPCQSRVRRCVRDLQRCLRLGICEY